MIAGQSKACDNRTFKDALTLITKPPTEDSACKHLAENTRDFFL